MSEKNANTVWTREPVLRPNYGAATGRIRVLEDRMLRTEDYRRLASGVSYTERADLLERAGYGGDGTLDQRLIAGRDQNDLLLKELTHDNILATFLLLELDYHNLKAILRYLTLLHLEREEASAHQHSPSEEGTSAEQKTIPQALQRLIRSTAPTDPETLYVTLLRLMREEDPADHAGKPVTSENRTEKPETSENRAEKPEYSTNRIEKPEASANHAPHSGLEPEIPEGIRPLFYEHMRQVVRIAATSVELSDSDLLADQLCFREMEALASSREASEARAFLVDYVSILADSANLEILFRIQRGGESRAFLQQALVPGGKVSPDEVLALYDKDLEAIRKVYQKTLLSDVVEVLPAYQSKEDIRNYGKAKDYVLLRLAMLGKRQTAGTEAIVGYWLGKKLEIKNLRIILQAIARGLSQNEIMAMVRPAYGGYSV